MADIHKKPNISQPKSQKSDLPIKTFQEVQDEVAELAHPVSPLMFSIDDLIDVWCRGLTNGATLWQYCQDREYVMPSTFEAGVLELVNEVRNSDDKAHALQQLINNNMILLGVFEEKQ